FARGDEVNQAQIIVFVQPASVVSHEVVRDRRQLFLRKTKVHPRRMQGAHETVEVVNQPIEPVVKGAGHFRDRGSHDHARVVNGHVSLGSRNEPAVQIDEWLGHESAPWPGSPSCPRHGHLYISSTSPTSVCRRRYTASTWCAVCTIGSNVTDTCRPPTASRRRNGGSALSANSSRTAAITRATNPSSTRPITLNI